MLQKDLNSYYYLFLFFISTFVLQAWGQEDGLQTTAENNVLIIIGLVGGCIIMVIVCIITRCILGYLLIAKRPIHPKPGKDALNLNTTASQIDSFTSEYYYNVAVDNHPKNSVIPPSRPTIPPPYKPTGSIEVLRRVENDYEVSGLYAKKESNDYDEIRHSKVKSNNSVLSRNDYEGMVPSKLEFVRSLTPQSNRSSPDNNEYVIDQITPTSEYEGMVPVTANENEGMKSSDSGYVINSLSSGLEVAYYSIHPNLEYDYITVPAPRTFSASLKPIVPPKPSCCILPRSKSMDMV